MHFMRIVNIQGAIIGFILCPCGANFAGEYLIKGVGRAS